MVIDGILIIFGVEFGIERKQNRTHNHKLFQHDEWTVQHTPELLTHLVLLMRYMQDKEKHVVLLVAPADLLWLDCDQRIKGQSDGQTWP